MKTLQKVKEYYKNSPRRIGWTWIGVHVFFLLFGMSIILGRDEIISFTPDALLGLLMMAGILVGLFPTVSVSRFFFESYSLFFFFLTVCGYYSLFFYMIYLARDMQQKKFFWVSRVFSAWFILSLVISMYILFS